MMNNLEIWDLISRLLGIIMFVISPIFVPLMILYQQRDQIVRYYMDCYDTIVGNVSFDLKVIIKSIFKI